MLIPNSPQALPLVGWPRPSPEGALNAGNTFLSSGPARNRAAPPPALGLGSAQSTAEAPPLGALVFAPGLAAGWALSRWTGQAEAEHGQG